VIEGCEAAGIELTHVYGLTEVYGPAAVCAKQESLGGRCRSKSAPGSTGARACLTPAARRDGAGPRPCNPVPCRRRNHGRDLLPRQRRDEGLPEEPQAATAEAFAGGWFHTGDLAVMYPDGYVKIKDRSKDIIISGGENISSIEVEDALLPPPRRDGPPWWPSPTPSGAKCPARSWNSSPALHVSEAELIEFCRTHLARFKVPKRVVFGELPKTSTGKIQKFMLRNAGQVASAIE
jgi:fatty-acyl-CoA synthase